MAKSQGINLREFAQEICIGAIILITYFPTFIWMWDRWFARDSYYTHGILIPFVVGYLIWKKRDDLAKLPIQASHWGMKLIILGLAIHIISALFRVYFTSGFSLIIVLMGLILHVYGTRVLKELLFPISFLVFMVPLPMVIISNISFKLKIFASQIAAYFLNEHLRIPCIQQGSTIIMRHAHVIVDDVCSGLRSLISLTALGALFAYWMTGGPVKRLVLFFSTIPIAVLTNVVRIVFLACVSEIWGAQYASGFLHEFSGFVVFGLAFLMLYIIERVLD